ncbi:MAG: D-sedoheptulose 7-phosphate isomerase [bacterium]
MSSEEKAYLSGLIAEQREAWERFHREAPEIVLLIAHQLTEALQKGGKILLCGNGGSAADAQHVAGELVGRFARERRALPAIALTTDTSILTALGNDYGFERVFARQVEALSHPGDILVGISTSGKSPNVLEALKIAKEKGLKTIGFTGGNGGLMVDLCDLCFIAPAHRTPRIQEIHIAAWHLICDLVEKAIVEQGQR